MRTIIDIVFVEEKVSKKGEKYWKTFAILDDGTEATGYGRDFKLGMLVEVFYEDKWNIIKMRKG